MLAAVILLLAFDPEPRYHGHSLTYWVDKYVSRPETAVQREAAEALANMGTNALPFLLTRLRYEPARFRVWTWQALQQVPRRWKWLHDCAYDPQRQALNAALTFAELGVAARPALPALAAIARDPASPSAAYHAQLAIALLGADGLPSLVEVLDDTNAPNRASAVLHIGGFPKPQSNGAAAVPALVRCLDQGDPVVQAYAIEALGNLALNPEIAVPALVRSATPSRNTDVRLRAFQALSRFGEGARAAVPALQSAMQDEDSLIRFGASLALSRIAPESNTNAPPP